MTSVTIDGRPIGAAHRPYVIAEISANHNGSLDTAVELVGIAKASGADAIKLQHYTPDTITVRSDHPDFKVSGGTLWDGAQLADLYAEAMTPWEWTGALVAEAKRVGISWFSSPFDPTAVDFLAEFDPPAYKVASFELIDLPLIRQIASHGKPMVMSTGMATLAEIEAGVGAAREAGATEILLLRCNSGYPAKPSEMDLRAIPTMHDLFGVPVGLSDHTMGNTAAITATALGACAFEKHLIKSRADGGPDAAFSAEPAELKGLVDATTEAHAMLGRVRFGPSEKEVTSRKFRPSLRAVAPIKAGEPITDDVVKSVRPAGGLEPDAMRAITGWVAAEDLETGAPITWEVLQRGPNRA